MKYTGHYAEYKVILVYMDGIAKPMACFQGGSWFVLRRWYFMR